MRKSTKVLIVLTILSMVPGFFLTQYLLQAIIPTGSGFVFNFTPLAWVALAFQVVSNVLLGILFFRFIKTQRLSNAIFFSMFPLTLTYGAFMCYIVGVKDMSGVVAESVRATMNITATETSYNNYLWAGLATLVYLIILFFTVLFACKPLSKVEFATQKLGDGRMKQDKIKVGGGKQFKHIENSLNKINYNFREKENKLKHTNLEEKRFIPKQFLKFLGKNNISDLELGKQVTKTATILVCDLKNLASNIEILSLEENFNYISSYIKVVAPLVRRYGGFIDKYLGDGVLAVFDKPQAAIECSHAILKSIELKNKGNKDFSQTDTRIAVHTTEVVFGIVGDDQNKSPTIVSDIVKLMNKILEVNAYIGTKMLVTKQTLNELPENFDFECRYTGALAVDDGFHLALFESLDYYSKNRRQSLKKLKSKFEQGIRAYNEKKFDEARAIFEKILKEIPDDKVSYVYFNKANEKLSEAV